MKKFIETWNYDLDQMPFVGEKIIIDFGNGNGSDRRYPYLVEIIDVNERGCFDTYTIEGRQLRKDGTLKSNWFQLIFTNKPKGHHGWDKDSKCWDKEVA
mgnify:CR=1 FL=1|tara:strand:- start:113 stop:409 length:297 start_codon:yes stop_codon:yes gene_type:complete